MRTRLGIVLSLFVTTAFAQSGVAVKQSGNVTPNQVPWWVTSGVIGGGVSSADSPVTSFGVTNNGGNGICIASDRITAVGRNLLCLGASTAGSATISLQNYGTASPQALCFIVNGLPICFGGGSSGSGFVTAALPTTTGAVTCWTNASGNLSDCSSGPATLLGNPGATGSKAAPFTIQGLPARGAPDANNDKIPLYNFATGALDYVTPGQIASAATAGVASLAGVTGAILIDNSLVMNGSTLGTARARLTGDLNLFVRTDGNDSNSCLVNNAGGACLTMPAAVTKAFNNFDSQGHDINVNVASGTYTACVTVNGQLFGGGTLNFVGNATPSNDFIDVANCDAFSIDHAARVSISGFKIRTVGSGSHIRNNDSSYTLIGNMEFGATAESHISNQSGSTVFAFTGYTVSGGGISHIHATGASITVMVGAIAYTGTPNFSAYNIGIAGFSNVDFSGATMSGSATGPRFAVHDFAELNMPPTADLTYIPGSVAGLIADFGLVVGSNPRWGASPSQGVAWLSWTPTVTSSGGSGLVASATGNYKIIENQTCMSATVTITTVGLATGLVFATLVNQATHATAFSGINLDTGKALAVLNQGSTDLVSIRTYDGFFPAIDGQRLIISGCYQNNG